MVYKLREISTWRSEVQIYWENEIDESGYSNIESLKTDLGTYLDDLESDYQSYISGSSLGELKQTLLQIFSYTTIKYNIIYPDSAPEVPELIDNKDIRTFYVNWNYELPTDYSTIFNLTDGSTTGTGVLQKDTGYNSVQDTLTNGTSYDNSELQSFRNDMPSAIQDLMIYQAYKQPKIEMQGLDIRCYTLQDMHLEDVLNDFNFTINGINENVDECE